MDWQRFHRQFNLAWDRDDLLWGLAAADFRNAHKGEGDMDYRPVDCMPYADPFEGDDLTREELLAKIGFGRLSGEANESPGG